MPPRKSRRVIQIERVVPATKKNGGPHRLVGSLDIDGNGTKHDLEECDPFILLDCASISKHAMPPFGRHPHAGHSVVTLLMQGKVTSWDSATQQTDTIQGPASYWVNAGTGLFHEEATVIEDEADPAQHAAVLQLWVGVTPEDRARPPSLSVATELPLRTVTDDDTSNDVIAAVRTYVGEGTGVETPHPILVQHIHQHAGTTYNVPVPAGQTGFIVNLSGASWLDSASKPATFGGNIRPSDTEDVLILSSTSSDCDENKCSDNDYITVETAADAPSDYMLCVGEPHRSPWCKKLVANGAVIAETPDQARGIAARVEGYAQQGRDSGSYAPFGR